MIEITIRDGRADRDRSQDTPEGGAILGTVQRDRPLDIGDTITLADGESRRRTSLGITRAGLAKRCVTWLKLL